jgi:hypothetical protein
MKLNFASKLKNSIKRRTLSRKLYNEDMLQTLSESERIALRGKYLRQLGLFSSLLLVSLLTLLGVYLLGSPKEDFTSNLTTYRKEQDLLAKKLNEIYGVGNWQYGVYQTEIDAFRVEVKLSDGSLVEHYYRVSGGNIYRLDLE